MHHHQLLILFALLIFAFGLVARFAERHSVTGPIVGDHDKDAVTAAKESSVCATSYARDGVSVKVCAGRVLEGDRCSDQSPLQLPCCCGRLSNCPVLPVSHDRLWRHQGEAPRTSKWRSPIASDLVQQCLKLTQLGKYTWNTIEGEGCTIFSSFGEPIRGTVLLNKSSGHVYCKEVSSTARSEATMEVRLEYQIASAGIYLQARGIPRPKP